MTKWQDEEEFFEHVQHQRGYGILHNAQGLVETLIILRTAWKYIQSGSIKCYTSKIVNIFHNFIIYPNMYKCT